MPRLRFARVQYDHGTRSLHNALFDLTCNISFDLKLSSSVVSTKLTTFCGKRITNYLMPLSPISQSTLLICIFTKKGQKDRSICASYITNFQTSKKHIHVVHKFTKTEGMGLITGTDSYCSCCRLNFQLFRYCIHVQSKSRSYIYDLYIFPQIVSF